MKFDIKTNEMKRMEGSDSSNPLLAPGGKKSLDFIGSMYNLAKINIGDNIERMDEFLKKEPKRFKEYAMRDALITLIHGCFMEYFYLKIGEIGIPTTLSKISRVFINKY